MCARCRPARPICQASSSQMQLLLLLLLCCLPAQPIECSSEQSSELKFELDQPAANSTISIKNESPPRTNQNKTTRGFLASSLDAIRIRLVKLLHKIAPELSCYTSYGEHYRGKASVSQDRRACLNWRLVRRFKAGGQQSNVGNKNNHSYCRNPTSDPNGPWCYVRYEPELDGPLHQAESIVTVQLANSTDLTSPVVVIQRHCPVSPCSKFLWLYIVAPPLGILLLLSCLIGLLVRSARKSHYSAMFSSSQRRPMSKLNRLLASTAARNKVRKFKNCGKKSYLDEDIFEIVDDLDWSHGHTQSLSPKSTESLKLNSSSFSSSSTNEPDSSRASGFKSTNQLISSDKTLGRTELFGNRSVTQVGPMFATLRCHIRHNKPSGLAAAAGQVNKSTSTFMEPTSKQHYANDWLLPSKSNENRQGSAATGAHLISCSNTTEDIESLNNYCQPESSIRASDLPQLSSKSVSLALNEQPIYEGKFGQVQLAYVRHQANELGDISAGLMGTQVAVCSIKQTAAIDQSIFSSPALIRLRNLNHLNVLKLIGYTYLDGDGGAEIGHSNHDEVKSCSLVYDMAQLVDLSDWIKQQSKDSVTSDRPGSDLGIRSNLACFAKQIALAVDYLHDLDIVHRDLACRNCFLDPTKMLVKLATFNHELLAPETPDSKTHSLKSMIRPKYLLDYYVIDSRPADCQLLPLSWIPLESILFNKFNKQTDVWSFGCLIYELFSLGEVAYFGYSSKQVIDAVRANLMPPKPLLCSTGIYKIMCKCLSDIPAIRPNIKQIYEQLNLYSGQCSSFLDHHLCSLVNP